MNMDSYAWIGSLRRVLWLPLLVMPLLLLAACDGTETQPEPPAPTTAVTAPGPPADGGVTGADSPQRRRQATLYNGVAQGLTSGRLPVPWAQPMRRSR